MVRQQAHAIALYNKQKAEKQIAQDKRLAQQLAAPSQANRIANQISEDERLAKAMLLKESYSAPTAESKPAAVSTDAKKHVAFVPTAETKPAAVTDDVRQGIATLLEFVKAWAKSGHTDHAAATFPMSSTGVPAVASAVDSSAVAGPSREAPSINPPTVSEHLLDSLGLEYLLHKTPSELHQMTGGTLTSVRHAYRALKLDKGTNKTMEKHNPKYKHRLAVAQLAFPVAEVFKAVHKGMNIKGDIGRFLVSKRIQEGAEMLASVMTNDVQGDVAVRSTKTLGDAGLSEAALKCLVHHVVEVIKRELAHN